ncbi:MAG: DNA polymerase III subunit beta [Xanthobacteraceae bacterium]
MNVVIKRAELARMLTAVSRVVEKRNTIPILGHVLLTAAAGVLSVRGTDLDIEISVEAEATIIASGAVAVDAGRLADIAKKVNGAEVSLEQVKTDLVVKSGRSRFVLRTMDPVDFPSLTAGEFTHNFDVDLTTLFGPTQFAISTEETRYYLNGVALQVYGDQIVAVSTDGHRLAKVTATLPDGAAGLPSIIVPKKAVSIAPKGTTAVSVSTSKIRFAGDGVTMTSKLIDGTFPDFERVIPKQNDRIVRVSRDELAKAVDRVLSVVDDKSRAVKLEVGDGNIRLSARGDDGEASEDIPVAFDSEPLTVGYNGRYMLELLAVLAGDQISIELADPGSPAVVRGAGPMLSVLMPMRVS